MGELKNITNDNDDSDDNELNLHVTTNSNISGTDITGTYTLDNECITASPDPAWSSSVTMISDIDCNYGTFFEPQVEEFTLSDENSIVTNCKVDNEVTPSIIGCENVQPLDDIMIYHIMDYRNGDDDSSLYAGLNACYDSTSVASVDDLLLDSILGFDNDTDWL
jgi:hypothetical protein